MDVLDEAVYWLFPSGALLCRSPRDLQRAGPAAGNTPDSKDDYEAVGAALGYQFLGGRCDTTELLQDPGTLAERRWTQLSWSLPESTLAACWWLTNAPPEDPKAAPDRDLSARPKLLCRSLGVLRVELHQNRVATIAKVRSERQRRRKQNAATELLLKQNPFWKRFATAEQRAAMGSLSATSLAALTSWASTTEAACRAEAAAEQEELCRIHQELLGLVRRLAGEQKHDVHSERFPLTPDGLFAQIWEAVLVRDDLDQVLRASRAMRLEGVAQAAHDLAAGGEDTEDDEDASHGQRPTERPEPDHFTQPLRRLPKGHLVALAHAEEVLLDRTLVKFDAHYDELFLQHEQQRIRTEVAAAGAEPEPGSLLPRRRRNAHHVDRKVLEARVSKRYEVFCLPEVVRTLFTKPAHEKDWEKLGQLARYVQQAARGSLDEAAAASPAPFPLVAWTEIPLSAFGQEVRASEGRRERRREV